MYFLEPLDRFRIERGARHLHKRGERAEFLAEEIGGGDDITSLLDRLHRYERCNPDLLHAVGGDRFPSRMTVVAGMIAARVRARRLREEILRLLSDGGADSTYDDAVEIRDLTIQLVDAEDEADTEMLLLLVPPA